MAAETLLRPCVLVVEDDRQISDVITGLLEDEGFAVRQAFDGRVALTILNAAAPRQGVALLILDMMLPSLDGASVLRALQAQDSAVPVIALSASPRHLPAALAAGAVAALAKPFDLAELLALVEHYCPRVVPTAPPAAD